MIIALSLITAILLLTFVPLLTNPARRPHEMIKKQILRITPLGTDIDDVIKVIESRNDWESPNINRSLGFAPLSPGRRGPPPDGQPDLFRIGEMSVSSYMGSYRNWFLFLVTDVSIFWGFDADGKLIEVYIWKVSGG